MSGGHNKDFAYTDVRAANFNAAAFVKEAKKYKDVTILMMRIGESEKVNAKSLLGVLSLNPKDKDVRILVSGNNGSRNKAVCDALKVLIA